MFRVSLLLSTTERKQRRIAARSGLSEERIREIASGMEPTTGEVVVLSRVLGIPLSELLADPESTSGTAFRFREMAADPTYENPRRRKKAVEDVSAKIEGFTELLRAGGYAVNRDRLPKYPSKITPSQLATIFRERCFGGDVVSPLTTLPRVMDECLGIIVVVTRSVELDGASAFIDGIPFAVIKAQFQPRMLFTLAHELGHVLAHWHLGEFAKIDPLASISRGGLRREPEERFANEFASDLLLPAVGVGIALKTIRDLTKQNHDYVGDIELLLLSRLFSVSFETAALRCEQLDLLPRGGARALYRALVDEHGTPEKRAESAGLPPRVTLDFPAMPETLVSAAIRAIRNGQMSVGRAIDRLGLPYSTLMRRAQESLH